MTFAVVLATYVLIVGIMAGCWVVGTRAGAALIHGTAVLPRLGRGAIVVACLSVGLIVCLWVYQVQFSFLLSLSPDVLEWHECPAQGCP